MHLAVRLIPKCIRTRRNAFGDGVNPECIWTRPDAFGDETHSGCNIDISEASETGAELLQWHGAY